MYVLRNLSFVDFLALDYLTKKLALPQVRFANDMGLWVLEPLGRGWLSALRPPTESEDIGRLRGALHQGRRLQRRRSVPARRVRQVGN